MLKNTILDYFNYEHLPPQLQDVSKKFYELAHWVNDNLEDGPEKTARRQRLRSKDNG